MNRLYTTYKEQLQIYTWLIKRHVSALFGHHQMVLRYIRSLYQWDHMVYIGLVSYQIEV